MRGKCATTTCKAFDPTLTGNCGRWFDRELCFDFTPEKFSVPEPEPATKYDPKSRYYDAGGIEVQEIIRAKLTREQYFGFLLGNAIKYSCRANFKGQKDRDIEKCARYAQWMQDFLIEDANESN